MNQDIRLGKYKVIKPIGKGGFGKVSLVTDSSNKKYALKYISKQQFADDLQFIYQEVKIMQGFNSQYIVKFYSSEEDQHFIYILMEYCNLGDLRKQMSQLKSKCYTIHQAAELLSDVIRGLQVIHSKKFIHRDIKIENILVHLDQNGKKHYKIADFGLSKNQERGTTILGTGQYMSPQIFEGVQYGYAVDMWAFGVLMYFLLNRSYPFQVNPFNDDLQDKWRYLCKQSKNFSYRSSIQKSKYKIIENCNDDTEDLFSRMFQINQDKRITFADIRRHPIFAPYFSDSIKEQSKIMYTQKWKVKDIADVLMAVVPYDLTTQKKKFKKVQETNVNVRISTARPQIGAFPKQRSFLQHKNDQINFLYDNFKEFKQATGILTLIQKAPLCYNLVKYFLSLKYNFIQSLRNKEYIKQHNLAHFASTQQFQKLIGEFQDELQGAKYQYQMLQSQCSDHLDEIQSIIETFKITFSDSWKNLDFQSSAFKKTYRKSTLYTFNKLKRFLKEKVPGNKYNYFLALTVISHAFNRLFKEKQHFQEVFKQYFEMSGTKCDTVDFGKLREWMTKTTGQQLNGVSKKIIKLYFQQ